MKMNFKRTLSLILAVLMVVTAIPLSGMATEEYTYVPSIPGRHAIYDQNGLVGDEACDGGTATCTTAAICEKCHREYDEKLEHNFTAQDEEDKFIKDSANCQTFKQYYKNCANPNCDEMGTEFFTGTTVGDHDWDEGTIKGAACEQDGKKVFECTVENCDETKTEDAPDSALGHDFSKPVESDDRKVEGSKATCSTGATYYLTCANEGCDVFSDDEDETFVGTPDEDAHTFQEIVDDDFLKSDATCSKKAVYYKWCSSCGRPSKNIAGFEDETFESGEPHAKPDLKDPDSICEVFYKRDENGKIVEDANGKPIVLRDREVILEATCSEAEGCSYLCARCGEPLVSAEDYKPNNPDVDYTGMLYFNYINGPLNPGHLLEKATINGKEVVLMELDESEAYWDATCEKEGKAKTYKCLYHGNRLDNIVGGEVIPVKGHSYDAAKEVKYRDADCRAAGHLASKSCTECKTTFYFDKAGKAAGTAKFDPSKAPLDETIRKLDHKDLDGDGLCDLDYIKADGTTDKCYLNANKDENNSNGCTCICHSTGFMYFIAMIVKFFWKLTGTRQYCGPECGTAHY